MSSRIRNRIKDYLRDFSEINCDLGQELGKGGPLVNFSEAVLHLPEDLVVRPGASWRFLEIWWVGALRRNATEVLTCIQNVSLRPGRHMHQMHRRLRRQLIIFADVAAMDPRVDALHDRREVDFVVIVVVWFFRN